MSIQKRIWQSRIQNLPPEETLGEGIKVTWTTGDSVKTEEKAAKRLDKKYRGKTVRMGEATDEDGKHYDKITIKVKSVKVGTVWDGGQHWPSIMFVDAKTNMGYFPGWEDNQTHYDVK